MLQLIAQVAALVAIVFAFLGARAVYVAMTLQPDYSTADLGGFDRILSPIMPAVIIRVAAALRGCLAILDMAFLSSTFRLIAAAGTLLHMHARRCSILYCT